MCNTHELVPGTENSRSVKCKFHMHFICHVSVVRFTWFRFAGSHGSHGSHVRTVHRFARFASSSGSHGTLVCAGRCCGSSGSVSADRAVCAVRTDLVPAVRSFLSVRTVHCSVPVRFAAFLSYEFRKL